MNNLDVTAVGLAIPFSGTVLGAMMVFFLKKQIKPAIEKFLLGFAAGVMMAASVWSLLIPAMELSVQKKIAPWFPCAVGFMIGIVFLLFLDNIIPHLHMNSDKPEGHPSKLGKSLMLMLAVTLHNIPEGMVVGVVFAGYLSSGVTITMQSALVLAVGIALQNFPEGAIISMPMVCNGTTKKRAFGYGVLSGIVEPIGSILTILLTAYITPVLPYILSFAAGAMIYVVVEELIPESQAGEHSNVGTIGVSIGFVLMMILDIALG